MTTVIEPQQSEDPEVSTPDSGSAHRKPIETVDIIAAVRAGRRGRFALTLASLMIGAIAGAVGWAFWTADRDTTDTVVAEVALSTAVAETRDLVLHVDYDGSLGFDSSASVTNSLDGTFTIVAAAGDRLTRGDVAYVVNDQPVVAFFGALPTWRDLNADSTDGRDIRQLEANLWELGYIVDLDDGAGPYLKVDDTFDWATAYAVQEWETDLGIATPDGTFETSSVVFLPGEVRVDDPVTAGAAARSGSVVFTATATTLVTDQIDDEAGIVVGQTQTPTEKVTLQVDTTEQGTFATGNPVDIILSDGRIAGGAVGEISEVARRVGNGAQGTLVIDIEIAVTDVPTGGLLEGPVTIRIIDEEVTGATAIPVRALVALAEGGYGVEIQTDSGTRLVGVETGMFVEGWVEVTGIESGDSVVVPS